MGMTSAHHVTSNTASTLCIRDSYPVVLHRHDSMFVHMQADSEEIQQRFNCWQEAVKRSFNLEKFELH